MLDLPELFAPARIVSVRLSSDCSSNIELYPFAVVAEMAEGSSELS